MTQIHSATLKVIQGGRITIPTEADIKRVLVKYKSAKIDPYVDQVAGKKLIEKESEL